MKKRDKFICFIKSMIKVLSAGILSIGILSLLLCAYSLTPVHIDNPRGNTDYVWAPDSIWVSATEGFSIGRHDANGYNNPAVIENPDILVLGSSQMEAHDVMPKEAAYSLLSKKLDGLYSVYNMGISGHYIEKTSQYLPDNLALYDTPPKVVIFETSDPYIGQTEMDQILNHTVPRTPSKGTGVIGALMKLPFLRLTYHQIDAGLLRLFRHSRSSAGNTAAPASVNPTEEVVPEDVLVAYFTYLSNLEAQYGTKFIIVYHPVGELCADGTLEFRETSYVKAFKQYATDYDIRLIDMTEPFLQMYAEDHHVPHGFMSSRLESGHLNAYGHAAIADAVYEEIMAMREEGLFCQ